MNELQRKVEEMRHRDRGRAEENRRRMPEVTSVIDEFRDVFGGDVTVRYASENGITMGKKTEGGVKLSETLVGAWNRPKK